MNNMPIRILHMIGGLNIGGSQTMIMNLYRKIDKTKIQFDFIVDKQNELFFADEIVSLGGKIHFMPRFNGKNYCEIKKEWNSFFNKHPEYHIIHSHVRSYASIFLSIAKKHGLLTIIHSHSTSNGKGFRSFGKKILQLPLRNIADYFFACSKESGIWLFGNKIIKSDKFFILNNAIDVAKYSNNSNRHQIRQSLNIDNDTIAVGTVGRLSFPKNHDFIIELIDSLAKSEIKFIFLWVGDGGLMDTINKKISNRNLTNYVYMLGNRKDVDLLLSAFDIFILPSFWEGLPVSAIEAQASGLPCLISNKVTKDIDFSDLIHYLPIDCGTKEWVDSIKKYAFTRKSVADAIANHGFDINITSKWLTKFYLGIIENKENDK